jgi:nitronate monooxygenase
MKLLGQAPQIIQGGMGVGVSNWRLARAVALGGQMGVVSGTALDSVFARRLQLGDLDGAMRRALAAFPWPDLAQRALADYYVPGGKPAGAPFKLIPMSSLRMSRRSVALLILGNYAEVYLAKEGHSGWVGINYLEKIQMPTLPSLLGAILAGVDAILMGGGIPLAIPGAIDGLMRWEPVELRVDVGDNVQGQAYMQRLDPSAYGPVACPDLTRPYFLPIVSSDVVAKALMRRATGPIDGFIVEDYTAGGHNAPPRRTGGSRAEAPSFGPKDVPDLAGIHALGRPFWVAGGRASPARLREARAAGAHGIQVGTIFAYCQESGITPEIKARVMDVLATGGLTVETDFLASPTGYPFKIMPLAAAEGIGAVERERVCDLGYLRQPYCTGQADIGYRCPGEPVDSYTAKGGAQADTLGRQCLCNGLMATIGLGQERAAGSEAPIITSGEDLSAVAAMVARVSRSYTAQDVLDYLAS